MEIDNELKDIIIKAIPAEDCPVKNAYAMHRRELLETRLIEYIKAKNGSIDNDKY